jgi:hypothetical protein
MQHNPSHLQRRWVNLACGARLKQNGTDQTHTRTPPALSQSHTPETVLPWGHDVASAQHLYQGGNETLVNLIFGQTPIWSSPTLVKPDGQT